MKLSIALSSILAVCSVTTATPVLSTTTTSVESTSTATTSVESTSTTASPNAIATSGPDYLKYPSPYDEYASHCHPITLEMLMLLEEFVLIGLGCDALSDEIDERRVKIYAEVDIMDELQERFDTVMGDSSNYGLGNLDLEAAIRTQHELLEKLHKESMGLLGKHWNGVQESDKLLITLEKYFRQNFISDETEVYDIADPNEFLEFRRCHEFLRSHLSQSQSQP
ncbi:hypothetical protein O5D80_001594 [Batrachochytrium dendrobatidis]|nr:hypothetical protein O5D80_001594 [Batrachochytrium dendrobatidis]